jgi:hypothetical protein
LNSLRPVEIQLSHRLRLLRATVIAIGTVSTTGQLKNQSESVATIKAAIRFRLLSGCKLIIALVVSRVQTLAKLPRKAVETCVPKQKNTFGTGYRTNSDFQSV